MQVWLMPNSRTSRLSISAADLPSTRPTRRQLRAAERERESAQSSDPDPDLPSGSSPTAKELAMRAEHIRALQAAVYRDDGAGAHRATGSDTDAPAATDGAFGQVMASAYAATQGHLGEAVSGDRRLIRAALSPRTALIAAFALLALSIIALMWHHRAMEVVAPSNISANANGPGAGAAARSSRTASHPPTTASTSPTSTPSTSPTSAQSEVSPDAGALVVHVSGEVANPGVVRLPAEARVVDAIEAAGGLTESADPAAINLAAPLSDGQQVHIARRGETVPVPGIHSGITPAGPTSATTEDGALINLNTASAEQLEALPRIGPSLAARIVEYREDNGLFASIDDLVNVSGIGPAILESIRDRLTLGP